MTAAPRELGTEIVDLCRSIGFARAGIAPVSPSEYQDELRAWLHAGKHGTMNWLAEHVDERLDPARILPGARSIIMVADLYAEHDELNTQSTPSHRGKLARYSRGADYHDIIKKRLHTLADSLRATYTEAHFRAFVDTAPILEREYAQRTGLGWIGKHTLLIHPQLGSWMLLGGILTTLDLEPPASQQPITDHCGTCTRCIDACPTRAITPYSVDATRCISYLTIEHRTPIDPAFHEPIGQWLFGCDICQEVCPHNRPRTQSPEITANPAYAPRRDSFDLLEVLNWSEDDRRRELAGSSMKRAKLTMWKRNALIVASNALRTAPNDELRERINTIAADSSEDELVRHTARDIIAHLNQST